MTSKPTERIAADSDDEPGADAPAEQLTPGRVLDHGRYRLLSQVGSDERCNAELWRAKDGVLGRDVALTILVGDRADAEAATNARRTLERAMHASTFNHVGVARVLDVVTSSAGDPPGVLGLVIAEWTHGTDLLDLVAEGPLPPGTAARLMQPLAAAVEAAHHAGLVLGADHPQRIRVTPEGEVRMAFPGPLAHATSSDDVRGLGAALYLLLTGRWALGDAPEGLPAAPTGPDGNLVAPRTLRPTVPMELSTVAVRALGNPDSTGTTGGVRTGAAVLRVLEQYATYEPTNTLSNGAPPAESNEVWRREDPKPDKTRNKKLAVSVGVLAVATILVIGWIAVGVIGIFTESNQSSGTGTVISGNNPGTSAQQPSPQAAPVRISEGTSFTAQGNPDAPARINNLFDGDPSTYWSTFGYFQQLGPGGINTATGAVLTLERPAVLQQVVINSPSAGSKVEIRQVDGSPSMNSKLLGSATLNSGDTPIKLEAVAPSSKIMVVLTQLAQDGGEYSSKINEITVSGSAA
ncbi:protein kinase family protein [Saccharopolyspora sp. TS4A08]|uniref:Protein kinase family protein n=1 Tax=Saccharopolyspora ipomoeae TaxID=3042027 RepID=A0ABT6PTM4_9PSEU|nr:protein kinase family protein [Saccharopolyspora sp. TS4A08]MDI2031333.1 protein kinase family protein [Saccharopolyspora sp. TS4A08]